MFMLKDLPDAAVLKKFADRYPDAQPELVMQFLTVLRIGSDLSDKLDGFLARYGLLQGRWWVLILLMRENSLTSTPSALAEKAGVSRATMTGLIDGLERDGLVQRLADDADRRKFAIQLTAAGQEKLDEVMPEYYRRVAGMMNTLSVEERSDLVTLLKTLKDVSRMFD